MATATDIWSLDEISEDRYDADVLYSQLDRTLATYRELFWKFKHLEEENDRLKYANRVLTLKLGTSCRSDFAGLPPEILLIIFRKALAPVWVLEGSKSLAPFPTDVSSVDLRMKHALLSVCKSWHGVGTELLYEAVTLRRIIQLPVFVRALESRAGLGSLVKHLDIDSFIPRGYSKLHEHESKRILELCPNLSHVGFSPPFGIPELPPILPAMSSSITSLAFSSSIPYSAILPALVHLCSSLTSLAFTIPSAEDDHPPLTFDKLEDLRLTLEVYSVVLGANWRAPALRRLWLCREHVTNAEVPLSVEHRRTEELLTAYGPTITFLMLSVFHLLCQEYLDRCPVLEHLVLHKPPYDIRHSALRFIDVFVSCDATGSRASPTNKFPSLRRYRHLDSATSVLQHIPLTAEVSGENEKAGTAGYTEDAGPSGHNEDAEAAGDNEDGQEETASTSEVPPTIENLPVLLGFNECAVNGPPIYWADHSDDDYVPEDDDDKGSVDYSSDYSESDSDSELDWGSGSGSCPGSGSDAVADDEGYDLNNPYYVGEYWEIGRDEAIELFYRTHED
ncbi:hypothetical protein C8R47DRAFT_1100821 [Mycena vitilis]|nr:hypothetical protein C8R47DRAFT_1100821 [Mycena vitilis]